VTLPPSGASASPDLHVGDAIVYRFSGSFSSEPVTVREEVRALQDKRVTIEVHATRGHEERRWVQVGPAGNDARWNNAVDEIKDLPNPDDATLARLWEWIVYPAEGEPANKTSAACDQKIGAGTLACTCESAVIGAVQTQQARCPFAWQRGPAKWTKNGAVVWQSEIVDSVVRLP
ncbi:MAG TPA: hypothetical protein VGH87_06735, partial [Polyangiaceae bacterium]